MTARRHRSPAQIRYAAKHPVLTVHFEPDTHARIVELREITGFTLNQLVRENLGAQERDINALLERGRQQGLEEGRQAGYTEGRLTGFREAKGRYRLVLPCAACDQPIDLRNGTDGARMILGVLVNYGISHSTCPPRSVTLRRLMREARKPDVR